MQLAGQDGVIGNATRQAATRQCAEFDLGDVHPTPVLGREMKLEAGFDSHGLLRREGLVERGGAVGVEVVLHEHDFFRVGKVLVGQGA